ncbi:6-bladed beta-propeller [Nocardioides sp. MAHUQ-72]|uniref:6-bladed beta-propeller n=1 Tax=unclassified Nocardioides TaxID=2615069 RepID=UPI0036120572
MDSDTRIAEALRRAGASFDPDTVGALGRVRSRDVRRHARRRAVAVGALVACVVAVAGIVLVRSSDGPGGARPGVGPTGAAPPAVGEAPLRVIRTLTAGSLGLERLLAVAVAPSGHLYVTDASQTVSELTPQGRVVRSWGGPGTAPGRFRMQTGSLAVGDDGRVYVVDTGNFRVQVFSADGAFLDAWGTFGEGPGQFLWPFDVAVDDQGGVYVADDRAVTLTRLSGSGDQVWRSGDPRDTPADLVGHTHFSQVDLDGNLLLANDDAGLVVRLAPDGREVAAFGSSSSGAHGGPTISPVGLFPEGACDASVDARGWVYVTSCGDPTDPDHTTRVFDTAGQLTGVWHDNPLSRSPVFAAEGRAWAVGSDGSLLELGVTG